jgi:hypothetical protein
MASNWKTLPNNLPIDGSTVWVRIEYYYGEPFKAIWNLSSKTFISVINSLEYPFWTVSRWKDV